MEKTEARSTLFPDEGPPFPRNLEGCETLPFSVVSPVSRHSPKDRTWLLYPISQAYPMLN
jgi:hypothetical protein